MTTPITESRPVPKFPGYLAMLGPGNRAFIGILIACVAYAGFMVVFLYLRFSG